MYNLGVFEDNRRFLSALSLESKKHETRNPIGFVHLSREVLGRLSELIIGKVV